MSDRPTGTRKPMLGTLASIAASFLGLALFVYFVQRAGLTEISVGVQRLGWMFLLVVALGGLRLAARAQAWRGCFTGKHRLTSSRAFLAVLAGDALGNLTPLNVLVGEPTKALFASNHEPASRSFPALAVENLFYTLSAAVVIAGGALTLMLRLGTTNVWWAPAAGLLLLLMALFSMTHVIIWRRLRVTSWLVARLRQRRGLVATFISHWTERLCRLEEHIYALYPRELRRLIRVTSWEFTFHALATLEVYIVLSLISGVSPSVLDAFIFESTNRFITAVFKVVPMRVGVDEAGTAAFAELLTFGTTTGVTLALIRKARMLVWVAAGTLLLVNRGVSFRLAIANAEATRGVSGTATASVQIPRGAVIAVMTRSPEDPRGPKTRLAGVLPRQEDRRRLQTAFLSDIISTCRTLAGITLRVAHTAEGGVSGFMRAGVTDDQLMPQRGYDLGERERGIFEDLFSAGFSPVVLIGSDLPNLPAHLISEAINRLQAHGDRVVLGPTVDGGYYLIGLATAHPQEPVPDLFTGIRWSSISTRADTIAAARSSGLIVDLLESWRDVDNEDDLTWLRTTLTNQDDALRAPTTKRVLDELLGDDSQLR
ncbi:MAG: TIGR04282 family arsenosugar biosynthesis glycosyltransferase [Acidobacteriota bacterium]|nr:TIGR04282 family arsenosugar biosynthesis glycosyltransferase [Acidobacteriota bacterium]